jgi:hypothetical protein
MKNPYAEGPVYLEQFLAIARQTLEIYDELPPGERRAYRAGYSARFHDPFYTDAPIPTRPRNRQPRLVKVLTS